MYYSINLPVTLKIMLFLRGRFESVITLTCGKKPQKLFVFYSDYLAICWSHGRESEKCILQGLFKSLEVSKSERVYKAVMTSGVCFVCRLECLSICFAC